MTIYDRIRELRISHKMSQTDLALKMGYKDGSMITKIESGKVDISQKKVIAFAKALDTTPAYLMGWVEEVDPSAPPDDPPRTHEARIVSGSLDRMPPEARQRALQLLSLAFSEYFKEDPDHDA